MFLFCVPFWSRSICQSLPSAAPQFYGNNSNGHIKMSSVCTLMHGPICLAHSCPIINLCVSTWNMNSPLCPWMQRRPYWHLLLQTRCRPAAGMWCRFSRQRLWELFIWGRWSDGYFSTSSDSPRPRINLRPHFTPLVCKLDVMKMKENIPASQQHWSKNVSATSKTRGTSEVQPCRWSVSHQTAERKRWLWLQKAGGKGVKM